MAYFAIVDPALRGRVGHHYNYDTCLATEAQRHGWTPLLFHHAELTEFSMPIRRVPLFSQSPYVVPLRADGTDPTMDAEYGRLSGAGIPSDSVVFVPIVRHNTLLSVAKWLARLYESSAPRVVLVIWTMEFGASGNPVEDALHMEVLRQALSILSSIENRRIFVLYTDQERRPEIRDAISGVVPACEQYVHLVPSWKLPDGKPTRREEPVVGFLGHGMPNKGIGHMPGVVQGTLKAFPQARFNLHVDTTFAEGLVAPGAPLRQALDIIGADSRVNLAWDHRTLIPTSRCWLTMTSSCCPITLSVRAVACSGRQRPWER